MESQTMAFTSANLTEAVHNKPTLWNSEQNATEETGMEPYCGETGLM